MRVYLDLGYDCRAAVDLTAAELDTLTKVLDRARPVSGWWHGDAELKLARKAQRRIQRPRGTCQRQAGGVRG